MKINNPFKKHEPKREIGEPTVGKDGKPTILLSINSLYQIDNKTKNPDQLLSITTMLMDYAAKMLSTYSEKYPEDMEGHEVKYQQVMDKMVEATHIYRLVDAGMSVQEAAEVMNLKVKSHEVPPRNS